MNMFIHRWEYSTWRVPLREAGYSVNCIIPSIEELSKPIDADVICVTGTTPQFDGMADVAKANPGKRLIAGALMPRQTHILSLKLAMIRL